tara:strand:- start:3736 stop:4197 length:462 start_codon:yes stop_codon:yes gene_type:complete
MLSVLRFKPIMKKLIKGKGTYPEKVIRRLLTDRGFSYYLNVKSLPGKPDILIRGTKKIIIIHGCFWHSHACKASVIPKTNTIEWTKRLQNNQMRDFFVLIKLVLLGYDILILWECEIKDSTTDSITDLLVNFIYSEENYEFLNIKEKELHAGK